MVIKGSIDEIRFRNDENGYSIITLDAEGEPVTVAGNFPPIAEGEEVEVSGEFVTHPKFGRQFKAATVSKTASPASEDGLVRFLGSGLIKGVGPRIALKIVSIFKKDTLNVLENRPNLLTVIPGISPKKAHVISEAFKENKAMQESIGFLTAHDIPVGTALRIYKEYKDETVAKITFNPYLLVEDIGGIGFITADRIAVKLGVDKDSGFRLRAGVLYALKDSAEKNGNTYLPIEELISVAAKLLCVEDEEKIRGVVGELNLARKIKLLTVEGAQCAMLTVVYRSEMGAAAQLVKLIDAGNRLSVDVAGDIDEFERIHNLIFHRGQKDAIMTAASSGVSVVTGGPGTGKTTIIKCLIEIFKKLNMTFLLAAPTGRAAKRLSESTGEEGKTIHRALMMSIGYNASDSGEPLTHDAIIVDEFSMVDIFLFNMLLSRIKEGCKLILVGDINQLPSVGAGNVLRDVIDSGLVPVSRLEHIYRQAEESLIIKNAHLINGGNMPELYNNKNDFFFVKAAEGEEIAASVVSLVSTRLPGYLGIDPVKIQVLCPMKNGAAGSHNLNKLLQQALNPKGGKKEIVLPDCIFREGDKVMHVANNYSLEWKRFQGYSYEEGSGVFNGDLGLIDAVNPETGEISVLFEDGRCAAYTPDIRNQLLLAYAITVHKSQGSEFDAAVIPVVPGSFMIMTRNLLYTAITRGKRFVALVGRENAVRQMVENNYIVKRYSALKDFLFEARKEFARLYGRDSQTENL